MNDKYPTPSYVGQEEHQKGVVSSWPMIHYATMNLLVHGEKATNYRGGDFSGQVRLLEQIIPNWIRIYQLFDEYSSKCPHLNTTVLHAAASANLIDIVVHLVRNNCDIDIQDEEGYTALHLAARWGHQSVTETLIYRGASIDLKTYEEQTLLVLAAGNGHVELVRWLLQQGASLNEATGDSGNALQAAAIDGHAIVIKVLLDAGADVNAQGGEYGNAIQAASASYEGDEKVVRMLLAAGADVHAQGGKYGNALQAASCGGREKKYQAVTKLAEARPMVRFNKLSQFLTQAADGVP